MENKWTSGTRTAAPESLRPKGPPPPAMRPSYEAQTARLQAEGLTAIAAALEHLAAAVARLAEAKV